MGINVVGKTYLVERYVKNISENYEMVYDDKIKISTKIDDKLYEIEILDTNGADDYENMMDCWINFGQGFLLVFALNDKESFERISQKRERILKGKKGEICPMILVGNKQDLDNIL